MKKVIAIACVVAILLAGSHWVVNVHYCQGKIASISFSGADTSCSKCTKPTHKKSCCPVEKKSCCEDVVSILKGDDIKKTSFPFAFDQQLTAIIIHPQEYFVNAIAVQGILENEVLAYAPPTWNTAPRYILHRSLII